jgi:hypothetical protein
MAFEVESPELQAWLKQLQAAELVPQETRRIIVDIPLQGIVRVYYECNADKRMFSIDLGVNLEPDNPVISVTEAAAAKEAV